MTGAANATRAVLASVALIACAAAPAASARIPAETSAATCPAAGTTLASASEARLYLAGGEVYGCSDRSGEPRLLETLPPDVPPEAIGTSGVAGRFAAYSFQKRVRVADVSD